LMLGTGGSLALLLFLSLGTPGACSKPPDVSAGAAVASMLACTDPSPAT
jgi:hypothetical protein